MTHPWDRNAGKYDRPSSAAPKAAEIPVAGFPAMLAPLLDEDRERYRGVEVVDHALDIVESVAVELLMDAPGESVSLLRAFVERRERIDDEIAELQADRRDFMREVKSAGFDIAGFNDVIRRRKLEPHDCERRDAIVETYESALGSGRRGMIDGGDLHAAPPPPTKKLLARRASLALAHANADARNL